MYNTMIHALQSSLKKIYRKSICNLLRELNKKNIGTNEVENQVKNMCKYMKDKETLGIKKEDNEIKN